MVILRLISSRIWRIIACVFFAFCCLAAYLFHLQIAQSALFYGLSQKNFMRQEKIASPRGNIMDCNGAVLATNRPLYTLFWQGTGKRSLSAHQLELIKYLDNVCGLTPAQHTLLATAERRKEKMKLLSDVPFEHLARLIEQYSQEKNIVLQKSFNRAYPHNKLACHIVGYLGLESDTFAKEVSGKAGLERMFNKELRGHSGKTIKIMNAIGHHLKEHNVSQALAGKTLQTTLNLPLQKIAEEVFPVDFEGCCLLMDEDGALEVVVSRPSFDPGIFLKPISLAEWQKLQLKNGFINRAFSALYPPASLFKLVTLTAALETGLMSPSMKWHCIGHTNFKGRAYHCNNQDGHGILSTEQALAHSCNIPFFEIGKKIKIDTLAQYAHAFGFGIKTGVLFPEKAGLVPTTAWKRRVKKEPWWPGETLSAVIGQSSLLVTPLQMACMINTIATGSRVRPRILSDEDIVKEPLEVSKETLNFLQQCISSVIKHGTGASLKRLSHFKIQGKSGTAQVQSLDKKILKKEQLPHGYFAAHFQYKNEKPRTLVLLVENAGSSSIAIKVALQFLEKYAAYTAAHHTK